MPTIIIAGDVCPIGANTSLFETGDAAALFGDLLPLLTSADVALANLECALIDRPTPVSKVGPVFGVSPKCLHGMRAGGLDVLCLANNHVLDHGPQGMASTLAACASAGIDVVGAGTNLSTARRVLVRRCGDVRIAFVAMAEHEFSIATQTTPGANPLDPIGFVRVVTAARGTYDVLVVLVHGGPEFMTAPTPRLKNTCHFLVEMGADAVIVQHPHALAGYERYQDRHIVYGQGALLMDEAIYRDLPSFHEGALVQLTIGADRVLSMDLIPFIQSEGGPGARRMPGERAERFMAALETKSRALLDDDYLREEWRRFCETHKHNYLSILMGHSRLLRVANRRGHLAPLLYRPRRMLGTRNVISCETHREALETILKEGLV